MKTIKLSILSFCITSVVMLSGCKKFFPDGINDDPTKLVSAEPSVLLPTAQANLAYYYGGDFSRFGSLLTQQVVGVSNQFASLQTYQFTDPDFANSWNALYRVTIKNIKDYTAVAQKRNNKHYEAIGKVLTAYTYATMVDFWGDIPFTEAVRAPEILQPKFDKGADVYAGCHKMLDDAIAMLGTTDEGVVPGADDVMFGGDVQKWIKFAHATKARMYMHTINLDASNIDKALAEITAADGINAVFNCAGNATNPAYQFQQNRAGDIGYAGSSLGLLMEAAQDPRWYAYVDTAIDGLGAYTGSTYSAVRLITPIELKFMQAECLARKGDAGAAAAYEEAINLSFADVGLTAADAATTKQVYTYDASEENINERIKPIMYQKYFAMFNHPEVFNDWRRTGWPTLTPTAGAKVPRRFLYPDTEKNTNENTPEGVTLFDKVFWDM